MKCNKANGFVVLTGFQEHVALGFHHRFQDHFHHIIDPVFFLHMLGNGLLNL